VSPTDDDEGKKDEPIEIASWIAFLQRRVNLWTVPPPRAPGRIAQPSRRFPQLLLGEMLVFIKAKSMKANIPIDFDTEIAI
jgi:hypothetical protein